MNDCRVQKIQDALDHLPYDEYPEGDTNSIVGYAVEVYANNDFRGMVLVDHPKAIAAAVKLVKGERLNQNELGAVIPNVKEVRDIEIRERNITVHAGTAYEEEDSYYTFAINGVEYDLQPFTQETVYYLCKQFELTQGELTSLKFQLED